MRWLIMVVAGFLVTINLIIGCGSFQINKTESSPTTDKNANAGKIITIQIRIKENLPIRTDLGLKDKYYVKLPKQKIKIINLINSLAISNTYFDILALDLNIMISENYTLVLTPRINAIRYYDRNTITSLPLINLGLNPDDTKQILHLFHNQNLNAEALLEQLKKVLVTSKRRFIILMHKFIIF